ncbi:MAG: hypothetical protein VXV99_00785, partial [Pseudomonadota bacterium]|nr:hypothetical protein [Pseudomonadota bacterium]
GVTPIVERERYRDRKPADKRADNGFVRALMEQFWDQPFERGNLDAGRLIWLFWREVKAYEDEFDAKSYEAKLILDLNLIKINFPETFDSDQRG